MPDYFIKGHHLPRRQHSGALRRNGYEGVTVNSGRRRQCRRHPPRRTNGATPSRHTVKVVKDGTLTGLDRTEDPDSTKISGVISLSNDHRTETDVNFGYIANNSINGTIYDGDRDGKKERHRGLLGVSVQLDKDGKVIATRRPTRT